MIVTVKKLKSFPARSYFAFCNVFYIWACPGHPYLYIESTDSIIRASARGHCVLLVIYHAWYMYMHTHTGYYFRGKEMNKVTLLKESFTDVI